MWVVEVPLHVLYNLYKFHKSCKVDVPDALARCIIVLQLGLFALNYIPRVTHMVQPLYYKVIIFRNYPQKTLLGLPTRARHRVFFVNSSSEKYPALKIVILYGILGCNLLCNKEVQGAVSIRKTVLPGMAIPMLKIRRPNGRLIFNMEIAIRR